MSNPSKQKGTAAETRVVKYLKSHGLDAERLALHGAKDEGDIRLILSEDNLQTEIRLEVKAGKQTANPSRKNFEEWIRQTIAESNNADKACFLIVARYNKSVKDYEVYMPGRTDEGPYIFMYLDTFVDHIT